MISFAALVVLILSFNKKK
ncbi:hypothetical protein [Paenibacillus jilunlii]